MTILLKNDWCGHGHTTNRIVLHSILHYAHSGERMSWPCHGSRRHTLPGNIKQLVSSEFCDHILRLELHLAALVLWAFHPLTLPPVLFVGCYLPDCPFSLSPFWCHLLYTSVMESKLINISESHIHLIVILSHTAQVRGVFLLNGGQDLSNHQRGVGEQ